MSSSWRYTGDGGEIRAELPFPPSVNSYLRHIEVKGRARTLISKRGRMYADVIRGLMLARGHTSRTEALLASTIHLHPPCKRKRDADNYVKPLHDALMNAGVFADDSQIKVLHVELHEPDPKNPRCTVVLVPIEAAGA